MYGSADRECRYSGARKGIGSIRGIGSPRGCRGCSGAVRGCQEDVTGCRGVRGVLGASRVCRYSGPEGV